MLGNLLWRIDLYVWPLTFQPVSVTWMCLQGSVRRGQDDVCVARNTQASTVTGKQLIMITSMFEHTHVPRKQCCVPCFSKQKSTCCNVSSFAVVPQDTKVTPPVFRASVTWMVQMEWSVHWRVASPAPVRRTLWVTAATCAPQDTTTSQNALVSLLSWNLQGL